MGRSSYLLVRGRSTRKGTISGTQETKGLSMFMGELQVEEGETISGIVLISKILCPLVV